MRTLTRDFGGPTPFKWVDPASIPPRAELLSCGIAYGFRGEDGRFEPDRRGQEWLAFEEPEDVVYWNPRTGFTATFEGRAFALGELAITNAATYALDDSLKIFGSISRWIEANGRGIFVLDWRRAFDKLRDAPRVECDSDDVSALYRQYMKPQRLPVMRVRRPPRSARNGS
ncbi:hypothetical protein FE844_003040 [Rhizobium indicum]|uniref:hypothetical protein n=1 Tax=Rhizobium indicum TaxID=2583231 RepID=UPI001105AEC6|nr:hypothetical protein [Rhizobium indicum]QKK28611.1 hypothetical protein FE844_003040 [Rhizobium indicum]